MLKRAVVATAILSVLAACGGSAGDAELPDGVVLLVEGNGDGAVPALLIDAEGRAYMAPPAEFAITGELLPDVWVQSLAPAGVDAVLAASPVEFVPDDLAALAGADNLGPLEFYLPEEYLFTATPVDDPGDAPVLRWPDSASVALADSDPCQRLPEIEVGEAFETAAAGSHFEQGGVIYEVIAQQAWPGATCP